MGSYAATHYVASITGYLKSPLRESFELRRFPGTKLEDLRRDKGALLAELQVDLQKYYAGLSRTEKEKTVKRLLAVEELRREQDVADALKTLTPLWKLAEIPLPVRFDSTVMPEVEPRLSLPKIDFPFSFPAF